MNNEDIKPQAAQADYQIPLTDSQYMDDKIAKMTAPRAADINQPQATQADYSDGYKPRSR